MIGDDRQSRGVLLTDFGIKNTVDYSYNRCVAFIHVGYNWKPTDLEASRQR